MIPTIPAGPNGTLVLYDDEGQVVQYSLEGIQAEFQSELYSSVRLELSARMAGESFVDLAPKVKTVADLSLGMLHETRIRVTAGEGIHEGVLHDIATETSSVNYGKSIGRRYITDIELVIGDARIPVKTTDLVEVIEEEEA